jgi:hypothetical protein
MFSPPVNSRAIEASSPPVPWYVFAVAISWNATRIHSAAAMRPGPAPVEQGVTAAGKPRDRYPEVRNKMSSNSSVDAGQVCCAEIPYGRDAITKKGIKTLHPILNDGKISKRARSE